MRSHAEQYDREEAMCITNNYSSKIFPRQEQALLTSFFASVVRDKELAIDTRG